MKFFNVNCRSSQTTVQFEWSQDVMFILIFGDGDCEIFLHQKIEEGGFGKELYHKLWAGVPSMEEIYTDIEENWDGVMPDGD
jgi:hypothetical protein